MRVEVNPDLYLTAEVEFGSERPDYDDGEVWYIHDYVVDHDYWDLLEQDPVD